MTFNQIDEMVFASPQITEADIDTAYNQGVRLIINNRPDGEEPGQPENAPLQTYAEAKGIKWFHIPLTAGQLTPEHIFETTEALATSDSPILAFCRSGARSTMLWGLSRAAKGLLSTDKILSNAAAAGYDFSMQRGLFDQIRPE